jgi:Family of unknown function (DUF6261)
MILTPLLRKYLNADFIQYQKDVISIINANSPATLHLDVQVTALQTALAPLDALFVTERGSDSTDDLVLLDARRDDALVGIHTVAEGYSHHFDAGFKDAAASVLKTMDNYGTHLSKLSLTAETSVITSLVTDLQDTKLAPALTALNITAWVAELQAANTAFNTLYLSRNSEYAAKPQGNIPDLRKQVTASYNQLVQHLAAYATLNPEEAGYVTITNQLNSIIKKYNENVNKRTGKDKPPVNPEAPVS